MFGFWMHFFLVLLCIGVGVTGKIIFDNLWALDDQIKRMNAPGPKLASTNFSSANMLAAMKESKLQADPAKADELRGKIKGK